MGEEIIAQVVFDIASAIEDYEARKPSRDAAQHRGSADQLHHECEPQVVMRLDSVDRVAHQVRYRHAERGRRKRAKDAKGVAMPEPADVAKQASHLARSRLAVMNRDESKFTAVGTAMILQRSPALEPPFVKLCVLQKDVKGRGHCRIESASAVAKSATQHVKIEEPPRRIPEQLERRHDAGLALGGGSRAETVHRGDVIGDVAIAEMQNRRA